MLDRLMGIRHQRARPFAELPVEVDRRAEGEHARGDATAKPLRRASEVLLEPQPVLEAVDDRLDALTDPADGGLGTVVLVGATGAYEVRPELAYGRLELAPGEALVADHEL